MDFDFSMSDIKWTTEQKNHVIQLRSEGKTPKKISTMTGVPVGLIKFWTHGIKSKKGRVASRAKHNDWLSWKAQSLAGGFRARYKEEIENGTCAAITSSDIRQWLVTVPKFCHYCQVPLTEKTLSVDHAQPVSRNGENAITNLRAACKACNTAKGSMTEQEYISLLAMVRTWEDGGKAVLARLKRGFVGRYNRN